MAPQPVMAITDRDSGHDVQVRLRAVEVRLEALDRLVAERKEATEQALQQQAVEYARRLDELNHAHRQAVDDRDSFMNVGICTTRHDELERWRRSVENTIATNNGKQIAYLWVIGIALTLLTLAVHFWK